ncbi:MAG: hypothetical protein F9K22_12605 [Bacteroidetes bacterium]|nr:MAG: hypothetical protein F9K22_12605 [Bacteroidota bacterium]
MRYALAVIGCIMLLAGCRQEIENAPPPTYVLHQNRPNPFRDSTTVEYGIPYLGSGAAGPNVRLAVVDRFGRRQATIVTSVNHPAGMFTVSYHGIGLNGRKLEMGIYYIELQTYDLSLLDAADTEVAARIAIFKQ